MKNALDHVVMDLRARDNQTSFSELRESLRQRGCDADEEAVSSLLLELQCRGYAMRTGNGLYQIRRQHRSPRRVLPSNFGGNKNWELTLFRIRSLLERLSGCRESIKFETLRTFLLEDSTCTENQANRLIKCAVAWGKLRQVEHGWYVLTGTSEATEWSRAPSQKSDESSKGSESVLQEFGDPVRPAPQPTQASMEDETEVMPPSEEEAYLREKISAARMQLGDLHKDRVHYERMRDEIAQGLRGNSDAIAGFEQQIQKFELLLRAVRLARMMRHFEEEELRS